MVERVMPYEDVGAHVRDELRRAWLRVEYQIRVGWSKGRPELRDSVLIGPDDMGQIFALARGEAVVDEASGASDVLAQYLEAHREVEARLHATIGTGASPLADLLGVFQLSPRQWMTLVFALLPELDPMFVHAFRYLVRDASCEGLDGRLLAQLVYDTPATRPMMARDLSAASPLLRHQLVEVTASNTRSTSPMARRIRAASRIVFMCDGGGSDLDPELADVAELRGGLPTGKFPELALERATAALQSSDVLFAVQGQRGAGKKLLLQLAAARCGRQLLVIHTSRFAARPAHQHGALVRTLVRELMIHDAIPAIVDIDDAIVGEGAPEELPPLARSLLQEWRGPLAITTMRERMPRIHERPLVHLPLEVPTRASRMELWLETVPALVETDAAALADRFAIPGGVIVAASQAAAAEVGRVPDVQALDRAVVAQLHQRISRLGKQLPTPFDFDDLVVDDDTRAALREIAAAAKARRKIRDDFQLRGAQGLSVLFSGHPGVGKTMSGTVLARQLGLAIYEVDLSQVVSKWLGETEKNLSDVFDAAEPGHAVLLFNEADSLFGKRTADVKSSNDRYANLETNYLLQRLERFNGLAILTTNLTSAIDQAFKRRFTYDVFFSFPSPEMRAELWRRTLPKRASSAIRFDGLAEKYELSGGFIKVACERAAYVAGAAGTEITETILRSTIERMYRERGKLSTVGPLE